MKIKAVLLSKVRLIKVNFQMKIRILNLKKKKRKGKKRKISICGVIDDKFCKVCIGSLLASSFQFLSPGNYTH